VWASACAFLGLPSPANVRTTCDEAVQLLAAACTAALDRPAAANFGIGAHEAVQSVLHVLSRTAQRSTAVASALAADPGGATLEAVAVEWIAEASALREGVLCWPLGSSTGAAVLILEREQNLADGSSAFTVTLCGGEGVEYHPQTNADEGRKLKAALALCFRGISSSLLLEPVLVFTLVQLAYVENVKLHTHRVLYEVVLPHLLQSRCFAEAYDEAQCVFESIPLDSIHSWERVLCHTACRHMLRRNGMTDADIKVLWLGIRQEIFKSFQSDASACGKYVATEASRAMCAAAARALGKRLISSREAAAVITLANEPRPGEHQLSAADEPATRLKRPDVSEDGMKRIFARQLPLANRSSPLLEDLPVELSACDLPARPSTVASDATGCLHVLEVVVRSCDQIRSSGLDDTENQDISVWLDAFQIISLITDVCCQRLPALATVGGARACVWSGAGPSLGSRDAQKLLTLLCQTALHLMAAANAALTVALAGLGPSDKGVGGSVAVCCGALFAWADAVVRGSDMVAAQHLRAYPGKICPSSSLGSGSGLGDITALLHPPPPLLELRRSVLSYWEAVDGESKGLWDWTGLDNTIQLAGDESIPAVNFALQFIGPIEDEAEAVLAGASLLVSEWEIAPEMKVLRDMSVMASLALHKAIGSHQSLGGNWISLKAMTPTWSLKKEAGGTKVRLRMLKQYSGNQYDISPESDILKWARWTTRVLVGLNYDWRGGALQNPTDGTQYVGIDPRGQITEHSILFGIPPSFGQQLGSDEAEMLMSTLLTPYLRLPIFLRFISEGRAAVLGNTAFRALFSDVLYEPGPWVSTISLRIPTTVPAHVKVNETKAPSSNAHSAAASGKFVRIGGDADVRLGSSSGFLEQEFRLDSTGVASMAASIVDQLIDLFSGGEIEFFMVDSSPGTSMDPDSGLEVPSSIQAGLLCGLSLTASVECMARRAEVSEATAEALATCTAARLRSTELIEAKVAAALARNAGKVDLGILQVVASTLSAWRWAATGEICEKAGVLLGWCTMMRVWLRQAAAASTEVLEKVLSNIDMDGWADAVSHIGECVGAMITSAPVAVRDEVLRTAMETALAGNCPDAMGTWEACGSFQWRLRRVWIHILTATVRIDGQRYSSIPRFLQKHSQFVELFEKSAKEAAPNTCTILNGSKDETVVKVWSQGCEYILQTCPQSLAVEGPPQPNKSDATEVKYAGQVWRESAPIDSIGNQHIQLRDRTTWFEADSREHERLIKNADGWLMLRILSADLWHVYQLLERCGELHEVVVFTSNGRWCPSSLPIPLEGTSLDHFPVGQGFEHPCELGRRMTAADVCPGEDFDLAVFRRRGTDRWDRLVPKWKLQSLLPAAMVETYRFWHLEGTDELHGKAIGSTATVTVNLQSATVLRTLEGAEAHLLCVAEAVAGTPWGRLAETLTLVESLGQVLVWARRDAKEQLLPVLVEMPRLRTELRPFTDHAGITRLHLKEDPALFVDGVAWGCKQQPERPKRCLPWELALSDGDSRRMLLVPNVRPCPRGRHPTLRCLDYDTGGQKRADAVVRPFYLYSVGDGDVLASTTAAALYLFTMRLHQRQYDMAATLVNQCASTVPYNREETWAASLVATTTVDQSPSAAACRLSMFEILLQNGTHVSWTVRDDAWRYLQGHLRVSSPCLMDQEAELIALQGVADRSQATHGVHRRFPTPGPEEAPEPVGRAAHLVKTRICFLSGMPESALPPPVSWSAGGGWRRLEAGLAASLRECLEDFTKDGDCWQDKLAAPFVTSALNGSALCEMYRAILTPGPSAGAPAAFLTLCAARNGELPVGLAGSTTGGASFVDLASRWTYLISQSIQEENDPIKLDQKAVYRFKKGDRWVSFYRNAHGGYDEVFDGEEPPLLEIKRSRTPWPRECILLLCALSAIPKPVYPPAKTALGAVSLKSLANRRKGAIFNWAWAFMHAAFTAVSTKEWMQRCAPAAQRLRWGSRNSGSYGFATVLQRRFYVKDTLQTTRRCMGDTHRHPMHDILATWMPREAKPPLPQQNESNSRLPFELNLATTATPEAADKLARLERSLLAFRKAARLETVPSVFQRAFEQDQAAALAHLTHTIELLEQLKRQSSDEYVNVLHSLRASDAACSEGSTDESLGRKLMGLAGIAPKLDLEYVTRALASSHGELDLQAAFPGIDADSVMNLATNALFLQSCQLQACRALSHAFAMRAMLASDAINLVELRHVATKLTAELSSQIYHAESVSGGISYDPRMLLFENCAGIILRQPQVALLREISAQVRGGTSRVHQMIMGQGKTTVITPVLVLMFSSQFMVTITAPAALLAMARSCLLVLSKLQKRTVTIAYSRVCPDGTDPILRAKTLRVTLDRARVTESAILSTPQTLKSIILHFIEMQAQICGGLPTTGGMPDQDTADWGVAFTPLIRCAAIRDELQKCLAAWHQGLLIMDEADVIFHPLKSELNFPVGHVLDVALTKPRIRGTTHLLAAVLDGACPALKAKMNEAVAAREMARTPHLLLVDRTGYDRFVPDLAAWMWQWLEEELQANDAVLLRREPVNMKASSVLDSKHGPECAVGGETTGSETDRGDGYRGTGFWCSAESPGSCEFSFEVLPPARLRTLRLQFKSVSSWPGRSGKTMIPSDVVIELSSDGGNTFAVSTRVPILHGNGETDGVQLPTAPKTTHVRMRLRGVAQWFAIRDIFFMAEQDTHATTRITKDDAVAYLADPQPTIADSAVPFVRDLMRIAHNLIHSLLPHALSKVYRVDYGLIQQGDKVQIEPSSDESRLPPRRLLTAVPFIGKDSPSPTAEFAHSDVIILLTFLSYRYAGLRKTDTNVLVYHMKDALATEGGRSRPSGRVFQQWLEDASAGSQGSEKVLLPLSMIDMGDTWQASAIHKALKHHHPAQAHYLLEVVLPQCLVFHESRLGATGEELGDSAVFGRRLAYTGTPNALLPQAMGECCYEELADGRMIDTLSSPEFVQYERVGEEWDVSSLLLSIATHEPPFCALIDPGALVIGMSNKDVAQALLDCGLAKAGMQGVVFLDSNDHRKILLLDGRVVPLEEAGVAPALRFTFYDQLHTCGMDISQPITGRAAVLIGKDMRLRDYTQACWRMRGIGAGQIIHTLIVDEVSRLVRRVSQTDNPAADLLGWLTLNEIQSERLQGIQLESLHARTEQRRQAYETLMQKEGVKPEHIAPYIADLSRQGSATIASREMDAEVEVEKEMEVENQSVDKKPYTQHWVPCPFDEDPWPVEDLADAMMSEDGTREQFWELRQFRPAPETPTLPFPSTVLVSRNHSWPSEEHHMVQSQRGGAPSRVKNVHCALVVVDRRGQRRVAAVSLAEAETLRWLLHHAPDTLMRGRISSGGDVSLWDVTTGVQLGGGESTAAAAPTLLEAGALRLFNCDVWLDAPMVQELASQTFAAATAQDVSQWMYQIMVLRRREWKTAPRAFEGSPVGQALRLDDDAAG
jgi:hypothetical protein